MQLRCLALTASLIIAFGSVFAASCGGAPNAGADRRVPPLVLTPPPDELSHTDADAIRNVGVAVGPSTGEYSMANVTSVEWVRAPLSAVNKYFVMFSPRPALGAYPGSTWDTEMWVFLFTGDFRKFDRRQPGGKGPVGHTLYMIVDPNEPAPFQVAAPAIDLSAIGTVSKVDPGENANIDAVRAPAGANPCCSVRLDMDPTTPGLQSSLAISGAQDININIVLDGNVGSVGAFNFTLIYDDTQLTPAGENGGGLKGNPDFNEAALGTAWDCSGGGSPSPDIDPEKGAGHGAALLSCYALAGGASLTTPAVIGTLHLHASAAVAASIALADVQFTHDDGTEIGSCDAPASGAMTCAGGSVVTQ